MPHELPPQVPDPTLPATRVTVHEGPAVFDPASLPVDRDPRYLAGDEIGRGGLGRVLAAHDRRLDRPVAVKELLRNGSDSAARFVREAQITARLQHPSIVPVHDAGRTTKGVPFYAMKRVHGRPFEALIRGCRTLEDRLALLPNMIAVAEAIAYAHSEGVVHRDLKPANILVGEYGETVVIDWGLAKDLRNGNEVDGESGVNEPVGPSPGDLTAEGAVLGTPIYMPPEQARGERVDERADVYALGAILYELFGGAPPFRGASVEVMAALQSSPPAPLAGRCPGLPVDLASIVGRAMARNKLRRYPTARELAEDLVRFQTGQLVGSHSYSMGEHVRRFVARNKAAVVVAAALGTALSVVGVTAVVHIVEANRLAERERAAAVVAGERQAERTRDLLVLQGRNALVSDPTMALAWLAQIDPLEGARARESAEIAAQAVGLGTARHVLRGHGDNVLAVALANDGKLAASGSRDRSVRLWDLGTGAGRVLGSHDALVNAVAFSPDGRWVASGGEEPSVRLWSTGAEGSRKLGAHTRGAVNVVAFAPDGTLVTAGEDAVVHVWDVTTGAERKLEGHTGNIVAVAFSPDGKTLASASEDRNLFVWDLPSGRGHALAGHGGTVWSVAFALDGKRLASASEDRTVRIWTLDGSAPPQVLAGHEAAVHSVRWMSPQKLTSGAGDGAVMVWDLEAVSHDVALWHQYPVWFTEVTHDGAWLVTGSWDKSVILHNVRTGARRTLRGHGEQIIWLDVARDGKTVATASDDGTVRIWPVPTGPEEVQRLRTDLGHVDLTADGRLVASAVSDGVRLHDRQSGTTRTLGGHDGRVTDVHFSRDGRRLASAGVDATIRVWDLAADRARPLVGHERTVNQVAFFPGDARLASGSDDGTVRIWDTVTAQCLKILRGHERIVLAVAVAPDGAHVASGSSDKTLRIWPTAGDDPPRVVSLGTTVPSVAFVGPADLVAAGYDGAVRRVHFDAKGVTVTEIAHQAAPVYMVAASAEGLVAAGGGARTVQVIGPTGMRVLAGHSGDIVGLAFAGGELASTGRDNQLRLWNLGGIPVVPTDGPRLRDWLARTTTATIASAASPATEVAH